MTLEKLRVFARAAAFEIISDSRYYSPSPYRMILNGEEHGRGNTNFVALFLLTPSMYYRLCLEFEDGQTLSCDFITDAESMCLNITKFGAVGDGITDCTAAIQGAIACCPSGGTVYIPQGNYLCYPLFLKSHITVYLDRGARLIGGAERKRYPVLPGMLQCEGGERSYGSWEGNPLDSFASLITAIDCVNVIIAGEGTIDSNAQAGDWWWEPKLRRTAWRPRTLFFNRCHEVTVLGVTVCNSPSWTIHPYYCHGVDILGIAVSNPEDSPNTDGCDPECCTDVRIIGAHFSVGDDCVSFKSGKYYMGRNHFRRTERLLVRNCLMDKGHGAVVLGSEISCGVDGLLVEKCIMQNTDRGLRVKTRRGRGSASIIDGIEFHNITMENVQTPFSVNMFYFCDPDGHSAYVESKTPLPVDHLTPSIGSLYCHNITCTGCHYAGAFLYGLPESPIGCVTLENVRISFDENAREGMPAMLNGIAPMKRRAIDAINVKRLVLRDVVFENYLGESLNLVGVEELITE